MLGVESTDDQLPALQPNLLQEVERVEVQSDKLYLSSYDLTSLTSYTDS